MQGWLKEKPGIKENITDHSMCDIKTPYKKKTKIVYKIVYKDIEGNYYSVVAGMRINLGNVSKCKKSPLITIRTFTQVSTSLKDYVRSIAFSTRYNFMKDGMFYNPLMEGRTCGFSSLKAARKWMKEERLVHSYSSCYILKIKLGGSIYEGTSKGFLEYPTVPVYAGSEILGFKEVE